MIDYNKSVKNLLKNITQEQVDIWSETNKSDKVSVDDFISKFEDYNQEGLVSLLAVCSMAPAKSDNESIEKAKDGKVALYHRLAERRLKSEGLSDEEIENKIIDNVTNAYDVDKLLDEEINIKKTEEKVYLGQGEEPPKGAKVETGPRQGRFYNPMGDAGSDIETRNISETIKTIAQAFSKNGFKLYEVGGSVRDGMLGKKSSDLDFTTDATPDKTKKILSDSGLGSVFVIGEEFGTVGLQIKDGDKIEITTFRKEVYPTSSRKPKVEYGTDLKTDLARRDFTINSMAKDAFTGELIDPFGGQEDLKNKKIKAVGNAKERFAEDPLRMMRAVRFASQLGFDAEVEMPEPEKLNNISKERINSELNKILISPNPRAGIDLLKKFGLMKHIIPDFEKLYGLIQNRHHYADAYGHTLDVVANASKHKMEGKDKLVLMLAALLHDIGKPRAKTGGNSDSVHFYDHEDIGSGMSKEILTGLHYDNETIERVSKLIKNHMRPLLAEPSQKSVNRLVRDLGEHDTRLLISLVQSDAAASVKKRDEDYDKYMEILNNTSMPKTKLSSPINGQEIMEKLSVPAGRMVGEVKEYLTNKVVDGELSPDDKDKAFEMAKKFLGDKNVTKSMTMPLFPNEEINVGMKEELEHKDITGGDPELTRKIVDAHLKEDPHYYSKLIEVGLIKKEGNDMEKSIDGKKKESADELKQRLLSNIEHFLEKHGDNQDTDEAKKDFLDIKNEIEKMGLYKTIAQENNVTKSDVFECEESLKKDIHVFLKGYETLAYLGADFSDERLNDLFQKAAIINENKQFNLSMDNSDRIGRIIGVDSVAHALHQNKNKDGSSQYQILDDLADVSKSFGEKERSTRLLIMENPDRASEIEKLLGLEILQKGNLERSGRFWKLMEKAIKEGISKLSNFELVALREWLYAKI